MKNYTAQLSKEDAQKMTDLYGSVYAGIQKSVAAFPLLQSISLAEIKGIFTREEIIAMVNTLNGSMHDDRFMANKNIMLYGFRDSETLDNGFSKYEASFPDFEKKFNTLTSVQCYFLIEEIRRFWDDGPAYGTPNPSLNKLIEKLT